ncbi:hypothetical protein LRY65_04555 [Candidatus Woesebacteria bacterium]|nr:hypothetical protein [Candidatus Woesebacteria bacterium]MCD8527444.1 hypothetical protein [Candidatus Woesebacteria bacterium]MCD8546186.1 hypothetical protein [Candidatus Woesebacteria bacterium]
MTCASSAVAIDVGGVRVRAVFPNPQGSDTTEWILIENNGSQPLTSGEITVRDTEGSVHGFTVAEEIAAGDFLFLPATVSGIALNNSTDTVEIVQNNTVMFTSKPYQDAEEDQVWWVSDENAWQWSPVAEFLVRLDNGDFAVSPSSQEEENTSPTPDLQGLPAVTPHPASVNEADPESTPDTPLVTPTPYLGQSPHLEASLATLSAQQQMPSEPLAFPQFDFSAQEDRFMQWKRQALLGSLLMIFSGGCFLVICVPYFWERYHWRF